MGFDYGLSYRYDTKADWTPRGMGLFKNGIIFIKRAPLMVFSRKRGIKGYIGQEDYCKKEFESSDFIEDFCEISIRKIDLERVIERFDQKKMFGVDEMMVMTLYENYLGLEGQMESNCTEKRDDMLTRLTYWHLEQSDGYTPDCKSKWLRHAICVFGVEYLEEISQSPMVIGKVTKMATLILNHVGDSNIEKPPPSTRMTVKFTELTADAQKPTYGSAAAAGADLYSSEDVVVPAKGKTCVSTGLQLELPGGHYGRVAPRSGLAAKHFIDVGAGVIDSDYRGEVKVLLFNFSDVDFEVKKGDRIAQLICERIGNPEYEQVTTLDTTERGAGGFGSTGQSAMSTETTNPTKNRIPVRFTQLNESAHTPTYGSGEAAGADLYSSEDVKVPAGAKLCVSTGIQMELPFGYYGRVAPRSGLAAKHFIDVGAGVVDSDYRGEVKVLLFNFSNVDFEVKKGDRIAQLVCEKIGHCVYEPAAELENTDRGAGGFGSTGKDAMEPVVKKARVDGEKIQVTMSENARLPSYGSADAAGADLYSSEDVVVPAKGKLCVSTGIQMKLPLGYYGRVAPRSGLAAKHFIDVGAGVIDSDYRGEVKVLLFNFNDTDFEVKRGDRIAQLICEQIALCDYQKVESLDGTERGDGGFGSTGK
uniref:dUTP diphosphatase n=1 Tax=Caenorhabditis tropicalis TaxID=1561998 RepID=A0A1I7UC26_9PELO